MVFARTVLQNLSFWHFSTHFLTSKTKELFCLQITAKHLTRSITNYYSSNCRSLGYRLFTLIYSVLTSKVVLILFPSMVSVQVLCRCYRVCLKVASSAQFYSTFSSM